MVGRSEQKMEGWLANTQGGLYELTAELADIRELRPSIS
jgi:hypothetical protein